MPFFDRSVKLQASIFPGGANWGNPGAVARELIAALQPEIEVYPLPIEVPPEAPAEIPRIMMLSADGAWQFSLSLARIDLSRLAQGDNQITEAMAADFWPTASQKLTAFAANYGLVVSRLAAFSESILGCDQQDGAPVDWMRRSLFSERLDVAVFEGLHEAEFNVCRQFQAQIGAVEPNINAWTRLRALHLANTNEPVLILQLDLNTSPDAHAEFDAAAIDAFLVGRAEEHRRWTERLIGGR